MRITKLTLFILVQLSILVFLTSAVIGDVLIVGGGGAYTDIQDAVDVAQDGDTVLVSPGTYGPILIDNIALNVIAKSSNYTTRVQGGITVQNLSSDKSLVLIGLESECVADDDRATVILMDNDGAIRLEACTFSGADGMNSYPHGKDSVQSLHCKDLAFIKCTIQGGDSDDDYSGNGGRAVSLTTINNVAFYDCALRGGDGGSPNNYPYGGNGGQGGTALKIGNSNTLFASGSHIRGGNGGDGENSNLLYLPGGNGGDGGHGIHLQYTEAQLIENDCQGGQGGERGYGFGSGINGIPGEDGVAILTQSSAVVNHLTGNAKILELDSPVREREMLELRFEGNANDLVGIFLAQGSSSVFAPAFNGQFLLKLSPAPLLVFFGTLPPSGVMNVTTRVPDMGVGIQADTIYSQSIFQDRNQITLGSARTLVILDELYLIR